MKQTKISAAMTPTHRIYSMSILSQTCRIINTSFGMFRERERVK